MTTVVVTNTELRPDLSPRPFARVEVGIVGVGWQGDGSLITNIVHGFFAGGVCSFALAPSPAGTWYVWNHSDGINRSTFIVPASGGPYTLQSLLVTAPTAAADPATTQAAVLALLGGYVPLARLAKDPDLLITGAITRNTDGVATSATLSWPDGSTGTYTVDTFNAVIPTAVDGYHVTYVPSSGPTKTYTQPAITRDSTGAPTNIPAITVS